MKKRKHAELIRAWANGAMIQHENAQGEWVDNHHPGWFDKTEYRIKPSESEVDYPVSTMSACEMSRAYHRQPFADEKQRCSDLANAVLRHACDNGQVVTRPDFDRAMGDRAARDMAVAKVVLDSLVWILSPIHDEVRRHLDESYLKALIFKVK